jgi:hypothetical protein
LADRRTEFLDQGYFVATALSRDEVQAIRDRFIEVFDNVARAHGRGSVRDDADIVSLYRDAKEIWVAAVDQFPYLPDVVGKSDDPRLLELARRTGIRLPAVSGFGVPILANMPADDAWLYRPHQDISYIPGSLNGITVWVPLQDSPPELGPLEVVPGTHRLGLLKTNGEKDVKRSELVPPYPDTAFIPVPVAQGQCIVFSKFLVHRSGRNRSAGVRFSLQFRYNDLASPEYCRRRLSFERLDEKDPAMRYAIDA